jgi:hypothetical protein
MSSTAESRDHGELRDMPQRAAKPLRDTAAPRPTARPEDQQSAAPGLDNGHHMLAAGTEMAAIYRDAIAAAEPDAQALLAAGAALARGMQRWQHATLDLAQRSTERAGGKLPRLFTCTSPLALAGLQREIYLDTMDGLFASGTTLLQLWALVVQDAARPLQERSRPPH